VARDLPPPDPTLHKVGGDDRGRRGHKQFALLRYFGLRPMYRVLEVGCGVGRLAYELADFLGDDGTYTGFDISERAIDWLNDHYAPRLPNFRFDYLDVRNARFHPSGGDAADIVHFPYPDGAFDFAVAFEVFMHMEQPAVENYLEELARVLDRDGRAVLTFMAILDEDAPGEYGGRPFVPAGGGVYTRLPDRDGWSLGYTDDLIRQMIDKAGLDIDATVEGQWHHPMARLAQIPQHGCDVYVVSRTGT
jgi:SAM-dependent methyltransferase